MIALLILAFLVSFFISILIIKYATNTGKMLDKDSINKPQKMHFGDIPRAGGVGIFISFCVFVALFAIFGEIHSKYIALIIPAIFIFSSGFLEDLHNSTSPKMRLLLQSVGCVCAITIFQNCVITDIGFTLPYAFAILWTLFCIVGVINAINIIDGFNGLASGCVILMLISIAIVSFNVGNESVFYLSLIAISAILGFFVLNFPKGRIFLGDGGAYLLGFLIAFLLIILTQDSANIQDSALNGDFVLSGDSSDFEGDSSVLSQKVDSSVSSVDADSSLKNAIFNSKVSAYYGLCIAIYPVFEVLFSIWRRRMRQLKAMQPDCIHLHTLIYRRITRSNHKTSIFIWIFIAPFIFLPIFFYDKTAILIAFIAIFIALYIFLYTKITRFKRLFKTNNFKI